MITSELSEVVVGSKIGPFQKSLLFLPVYLTLCVYVRRISCLGLCLQVRFVLRASASVFLLALSIRFRLLRVLGLDHGFGFCQGVGGCCFALESFTVVVFGSFLCVFDASVDYQLINISRQEEVDESSALDISCDLHPWLPP